VKLKIIQEEFFQSASVVYPSTETSASSTEPPTEASRSSQAVTLASPSAKLGSAKAQRMTAISGRRCYELLSKRDPLGCLLKTWLVTSRWVSTRCWLTWKPKATPAGRLLFQLVPSMPRIEETESGSSPSHWPTPNTMDSLPARSNIRKINNSRDGRKNRQVLSNLREAVVDPLYNQLWPTPVAHGDRAVNYKQGGTSLGYAARMWPTPTASENKAGTNPNGKMQKMLGNHPEVRNTGQGTLNPEWVSLLMGYPKGWTCLDDGQTDPGKTESLE